MPQNEQERIDSLIQAGGQFLFFAQQGMIESGKHSPGSILTGLAQVATLAKVSPEDWDAMLQTAFKLFTETMEARSGTQTS